MACKEPQAESLTLWLVSLGGGEGGVGDQQIAFRGAGLDPVNGNDLWGPKTQKMWSQKLKTCGIK